MSIIKLSNLNKAYGKKVVLKKFSLEIKTSDFVALIGPRGSGKTTLLNIIGLLEKIDEGSLIIDGETSIRPNSARARRIIREKISYYSPNFPLVEEETVEYNLNLATKFVKVSKKEKLKSIKESLIYFGLEGYEKLKIYELSREEQQRVSIARIMLKPSKIILADEPTSSLDEKNRVLIIEFLKKLNNEGKTILLVTHDKYVAKNSNQVINL